MITREIIDDFTVNKHVRFITEQEVWKLFGKFSWKRVEHFLCWTLGGFIVFGSLVYWVRYIDTLEDQKRAFYEQRFLTNIKNQDCKRIQRDSGQWIYQCKGGLYTGDELRYWKID